VAVTVLEVLPDAAGARARVRHDGSESELNVRFGGDPTAFAQTGESVLVELSYETVVAWSVVPDFDDTASGLWQDGDSTRIRGRVSNLVPLEDGDILIDIYVCNGPEFLLTRALDLGGEVPPEGTGLELVVGGLCLHPRHKRFE